MPGLAGILRAGVGRWRALCLLRIPRQAEHRFHAKPNTIPRQAEHRFHGRRTVIPRQAEQFRGSRRGIVSRPVEEAAHGRDRQTLLRQATKEGAGGLQESVHAQDQGDPPAQVRDASSRSAPSPAPWASRTRPSGTRCAASRLRASPGRCPLGSATQSSRSASTATHGQRAPDPREPDWARVHEELRRDKHVTLRLLWREYREAHPDGYGYSWFCQHYRAYVGRIDVVMRQTHRAGEKLFVDWAGDTLPYVDPATGELRQAHLFVAVLGFSNHTFARACADQATASFLTAHVDAFAYFGGAPELVVPDNLKTGVKKPDRYEAEIYAPYAELAAHYGCVVMPARVGKPRDKAKVEVGVQIAEREILAPLRKRTFFSLAEANAAIAERLAALNTRPFAKLPGSRASVFVEREAPLLRALPAEPYAYRTRKLGHGTHRLPRRARGPLLLGALPSRAREGRAALRRAHRRGLPRGRAHRAARALSAPAAGRARSKSTCRPSTAHVASWTPERIAGWAAKTGPQTAALCAGDHGRPPAPRARLPQLPRRPAARRSLRGGAPRGGRRAGARDGSGLLPLRALDPRARPRPRGRKPTPPLRRRSRTPTCAAPATTTEEETKGTDERRTHDRAPLRPAARADGRGLL